MNALAVMLVAPDRKLDLDAPINDVLQTWKLPDNELTRTSPVTLRRLLSHAGTPVHAFPGYAPGTAPPTLVQISTARRPPTRQPCASTPSPDRSSDTRAAASAFADSSGAVTPMPWPIAAKPRMSPTRFDPLANTTGNESSTRRRHQRRSR